MSSRWLNELPDAETTYQKVEKIFQQLGDPLLKSNDALIPNLNFLLALFEHVMELSNQNSAEPVQAECDAVNTTIYGRYNTESLMLMLGLAPLMWLKTNVKNKAINGHCRGVKHTANTPNCQHGYNFHNCLYTDLADLLDKFGKELRISFNPSRCPECNTVFGTLPEYENHKEKIHKLETNH
jgi:hypothetical protein